MNSRRLRFWTRMDDLVGRGRIVIERPKGSRHPNYEDLIYPLDYGYVEKTHANDGAELDVWVGKAVSPHVTGIVCTVDSLKRDTEIKVLWRCNESETALVLAFHNTGSQSGILVPRTDTG